MADTFKCERCSRIGVAFDDYGQWLCQECESGEESQGIRCENSSAEDDDA